MTDISEKAKDICAEHYKISCGSCPLTKECFATTAPGKEPLIRWRENINNSADKA